ncbi:class F sortase [Saccharothrix variisporea]|uniref:Sortase family protein n=1 Tax=Saccharothrix variisporea TaxID=543527 RepID=A0A495XGM1_9PSEU|nr:class F sortase [Saccharothrix variisporea]RKT72346.1 sortase family protein [Saccharothrix variisporea]
MARLSAGVLLGVALALAACSTPTEPTPPTTPTATTASAGTTTPAPAARAVRIDPTEVVIPKIGARSSLVPLGLNPDETVQVPPVEQPMQAGWYVHARAPGEPGPAIILGHVDGNSQPGIFHRLKELVPGDGIDVARADGSTVRFAVVRVDQVSKERFPTDAVYGDTPDPVLRLITCGGVFDRSARSYQDNVIVYAKMI